MKPEQRRLFPWMLALLVPGAACHKIVEGELFRPLATHAQCGDTIPVAPNPAQTSTTPLDITSILRWWDLSQGCVPITFDAELAGLVAELNAAASAWSSVGCTRLCFTTPTVGIDDDSHATCRIHVRSWNNILPRLAGEPGDSQVEVTETSFRSAEGSGRGQILGARIQLKTSELLGGPTRLLTHALGHAIGFDHPESEAVSIMAPFVEAWPAEGLSKSDQAALLSKYGTREQCP